LSIETLYAALEAPLFHVTAGSISEWAIERQSTIDNLQSAIRNLKSTI
jgi:hypothetical protein